MKKETVIKKLREIAINFSITPAEEYLNFIFDKLLESKISEKRFIRYANRILERETTMFNKMPPLSMFLNPKLDDHEKIIEALEIRKENEVLKLKGENRNE